MKYYVKMVFPPREKIPKQLAQISNQISGKVFLLDSLDNIQKELSAIFFNFLPLNKYKWNQISDSLENSFAFFLNDLIKQRKRNTQSVNTIFPYDWRIEIYKIRRTDYDFSQNTELLGIKDIGVKNKTFHLYYQLTKLDKEYFGDLLVDKKKCKLDIIYNNNAKEQIQAKLITFDDKLIIIDNWPLDQQEERYFQSQIWKHIIKPEG